MGMRALESSILAELRKVEGNDLIRQKDIMEWQLGDGERMKAKIVVGEKFVQLTIFGDQRVAVAYKPQVKS